MLLMAEYEFVKGLCLAVIGRYEALEATVPYDDEGECTSEGRLV